MANNEASFQTELLETMRKAGWHAFKVAKISVGGVPDLYVKAPGEPAVWMELKFEKFHPGHSVSGVPVNLTPLQRQFMRKEQQVGGHAGWVICTSPGGSHRSWDVYAGHNYEITRATPTYHVDRRIVGEKWKIERIVEAIIG
jgi:hypothetical protein